MKISVVCLASRSGGGLAILKDLYAYAAEVDSENQWQFVLSDQFLGTSTLNVEIVNAAPEYKGWWSRIRAEFTTGRRAVSRFDPDIVLSLQNVDTPARSRYPLAVYMHQALPFQKDYRLSFVKREERKLAWRQYLLKLPIVLSSKRSSVTFVQTHWLARNLKESVPDGNIVAVGHSEVSKQADERPEPREPDHFFYPASGTPYKNHRTLHQALRALNERGVDLTGKVAVTLTQQQLVEATGLDLCSELEWYRPLGWLTQAEVFEEYRSSILVFPSLVESLGLPLYEARNIGIPIIAGDTEFGREALDSYPNATWFDATDPEALADAMQGSLGESKPSRLEDPLETRPFVPWERMLEELEVVTKNHGVGK
ncbi:glycosyltransferase [Corynebacterium ammoniagenes]|uniref:Glycosyl transferase family 1 domain-containing protein n=1 Tax=Corynebacterium ammoniagenes TaxID=1697 RepID=A0AAV5G6S1_CORAM|nr:glycosyltransferase [Corynebacterium ammoniagenes]GJN42005.1 hypothetical protein CAT723_04840 [Corynebacterium ammoniagenes]